MPSASPFVSSQNSSLGKLLTTWFDHNGQLHGNTLHPSKQPYWQSACTRPISIFNLCCKAPAYTTRKKHVDSLTLVAPVIWQHDPEVSSFSTQNHPFTTTTDQRRISLIFKPFPACSALKKDLPGCCAWRAPAGRPNKYKGRAARPTQLQLGWPVRFSAAQECLGYQGVNP